jgi:SpoU rRNA methylase family enzyme
MQPPVADPIAYPKINLNGTDYEVKFRLSDMVNLKKNHDIDLFIATKIEGVAALERMAIVLQAGIAHVVVLSLQDIMDSIDVGEVPVYSLAIVEAQKKVSTAAQQALKALQDMVPKAPKSKIEPIN